MGRTRATFGAKRLAVLAIAALAIAVGACGSSRTDSTTQTATPAASRTSEAPPSATAPEFAAVDRDQDNDVQAPGDDTNNNYALDFGQPADSADAHAVTAVVKRYYAAAAAKNGASACALLYSPIAESAREDYGTTPPSQPYMRGNTCTVILTGLFKHFHAQIVVHNARLQVIRVRLLQHHGYAILAFKGLPERQIPVGREGTKWRIEGLLDSELP